MSSLTDAKLGNLCWTFVSRCHLSISYLKHHSSQWSQSFTSFIPHSLHSLSSLGTPFHLPVSICKGADPPRNIISILLWLFSCTFQHLPLRQFTYTAFKTQSLGLLPRSSVQTISIHLHAILLIISLSCLPETPTKVAQLQSCQPKASKHFPNLPIHWLLLYNILITLLLALLCFRALIVINP